MEGEISLPAFAKVNYTLDILSRRPDGYHNLATVLQTISLRDQVTLTKGNRPGISLVCNAEGVPADESNLAWRAAAAVLREARCRDGVRIHLQKRIPAQAGLGGGSSDAAAALRATNLLIEANLPPEKLRELAAEIGSDVPFFLTGGTASARGVGEQVSPLADGPRFWFVVAKPPAGISTAAAFQALDAMPDRVSARATRNMETLLAEGDPRRIAARMTNDFEAADLPAPVLLLFDDLMMSRAVTARLCGSGSAVFGITFSRPEAEETARLMRLKYEQVFVCRAVSRCESLAGQEETA